MSLRLFRTCSTHAGARHTSKMSGAANITAGPLGIGASSRSRVSLGSTTVYRRFFASKLMVTGHAVVAIRSSWIEDSTELSPDARSIACRPSVICRTISSSGAACHSCSCPHSPTVATHSTPVLPTARAQLTYSAKSIGSRTRCSKPSNLTHQILEDFTRAELSGLFRPDKLTQLLPASEPFPEEFARQKIPAYCV
jgi:hypothetical protein